VNLGATPLRWWVILLGSFVVGALAFAWSVHPVCVALSSDDVASFRQWLPLEQRRDRQLHGPVFQWRDGRWYQCKSWISRQLFF
jgi:hypothetical protein